MHGYGFGRLYNKIPNQSWCFPEKKNKKKINNHAWWRLERERERESGEITGEIRKAEASMHDSIGLPLSLSCSISVSGRSGRQATRKTKWN